METPRHLIVENGEATVVERQYTEEEMQMRFASRKKSLLVKNKGLCETSIIKQYDEFAQRNIADLRTNLDTGQPYTAEDLATMNTFIDSKRTLYKQYKDAITAATTIEELQAIDLNYDN